MLIGDIYRKLYGLIFSRPTNFKWLKANQIAGSGFINSDKALSFLINNKISAVLTLTTSSLDSEVLSNNNVQFKHIPIIDHSLPSTEHFIESVSFINDCVSFNKPVLVHCRAGIGRTGTILAAFLINSGMTVDESVHEVRKQRPGSIENRQINSLHDYFNHIKNNGPNNEN